MKRQVKWGIALGVSIAAVGAVLAIGATSGDSGPSVRIESVQRRNLVASVTASGWVRPHAAVDVQSDIMGRVIDLRVQEGDRVDQGQLLLRIDPAQYQAAVSRSRAAVSEAQAAEAQARANRLQAQRALQRIHDIARADTALVSQREIEDAEATAKVQDALYEAAQYRVQQARAALAEAENQLDKTVIRAPLTGVVTRLNVEQGEMAIIGTMNNPGSLLLTISDLAAMEAVVQVDETDVPDIHIGDSASVEIDAFPRQRFAGRVTEIGHSAIRSPEDAAKQLQGTSSGQAIDFEVVITLDHPPPALRPDLSATADVVTATQDSALAVPIIALTVRERKDEKIPLEEPQARQAQAAAKLNDQDEEGVFLYQGGKAHFTPVQVGIAGQDYFQVLSGLNPGDSVIAGPYEVIRDLEDDKPVRPMSPTADKTAPAKAKGDE